MESAVTSTFLGSQMELVVMAAASTFLEMESAVMAASTFLASSNTLQ